MWYQRQTDPSHSVVFEAGCERKDSSSTQQPIAALQTSMQMLAIATRFARMAHYEYGAPGRYVNGVLAGMSVVGVAVTVCLAGYCLLVGTSSRTRDQDKVARTARNFKMALPTVCCRHITTKHSLTAFMQIRRTQ